MELEFRYPNISPLRIPDQNLVGIYEPHTLPSPKDEKDIIRESLTHPIGAPQIREIARGKKRVLILVDDYTRTTPGDKILPFILDELKKAGAGDKDISFLIAQGTHRRMTHEEKGNKVGSNILSEFAVLDHEWEDERALEYLGTTSSGTEIWINKIVLEADLVIGLGHIVPHRITGFSGGGKIIQPGVCGEKTTGQTHWLGTSYEGREILGQAENPVRQEIDTIATKAGLALIVNAIQDAGGRIVGLVSGDPVKAHREGCKIARQVYGVPLPEAADIVIADSYPADVDLWQGCKGIFAAELAVKDGGVTILVSPCPEGVAAHHPWVATSRCLSCEELEPLVERGELEDLTGAAFLAYLGNIMVRRARCILVAPGIDPQIAKKMGFLVAEAPQKALDMALELTGRQARVIVLRHGGEILPLLSKD
jgi:nickel-dependent lactate racemase